jgi:hypothetical protein
LGRTEKIESRHKTKALAHAKASKIRKRGRMANAEKLGKQWVVLTRGRIKKPDGTPLRKTSTKRYKKRR